MRALWLALLLIGGLSVAVEAATASFAWTAPTLNEDSSPLTDIASYNVYRCSGWGCTPSLRSNVGLATSYQDTAVTLGVTYRYQVTAVNSAGREGPRSNIIEIGPPPAPVDLGLR